jgi:hypothetical protein
MCEPELWRAAFQRLAAEIHWLPHFNKRRLSVKTILAFAVALVLSLSSPAFATSPGAGWTLMGVSVTLEVDSSNSGAVIEHVSHQYSNDKTGEIIIVPMGSRIKRADVE